LENFISSVGTMIKTPLCIPILWWLHLVGAQCGGVPRETPGTTASPTTSASASVATQMVDVGEDGFVFNPDTIHVASGGKVEFKFYPGNHSVAQAAFNNPCHPISDTSFFSGFMPSANDGSVSS
jgi:plastocyanin